MQVLNKVSDVLRKVSFYKTEAHQYTVLCCIAFSLRYLNKEQIHFPT